MEHQLSMNLEWQTREILLIGWLPTVIVVHNWCHCRAVWLRSLAAGCSIDQPTLLYIRVCLKLRGTPQRRHWIGTICKSCWNAKYTIILNKEQIYCKRIKMMLSQLGKAPGGINPLGAQSKFMLSLVLHPERWVPKKVIQTFHEMSPVALSAVKFALQPNEHLFDNGSPLSGTLR